MTEPEVTALVIEVERLHHRAINRLMVTAAKFRGLGEQRMSELYEARARDLQLQLERHIAAIRQRGTAKEQTR